ncbi:MAG TPA: sulfocyanin-like copper-binding protein [Acidimicrobiia bacterium]|nr:sulfocyanin-like copper-binding protein [Acidimicrobiia bacterium]
MTRPTTRPRGTGAAVADVLAFPTPVAAGRRRRWATAALTGLLITVTFSVPAILFAARAGAMTPKTPAATVKVDENEFTISASAATVPAGRVRFVVHNTGHVKHELVVLRTNASATTVPLSGKSGRTVENGRGVKDVGEVENIKGGAVKSNTLKLAPGHYVLECNLSGHYMAGMRAEFQVQ